MIDTAKGFGVVDKAEVDVFLEFSCFFNDSTDIGFSKPAFLNLEILGSHILEA